MSEQGQSRVGIAQNHKSQNKSVSIWRLGMRLIFLMQLQLLYSTQHIVVVQVQVPVVACTYILLLVVSIILA